MKLTDFIKDIENIDQELIIFQEDLENHHSDIIFSFASEGDRCTKEVDGKIYFYLLEVFLAKEFLGDWEQSLGHKPSLEEKAKRLYEYAINDA